MKKCFLFLMVFIIVVCNTVMAQNTRTFTAAGSNLWDAPALWSLNHTPIAGEDVVVTLNNATGTGTTDLLIDGLTININNLTIINSSSSTLQTTFNVRGAAVVTIGGVLTITAPGANAGNIAAFTNRNTTTINGDVVLGQAALAPSSTAGYAAIGSDGVTTPNQTYNLLGNMVFNPRSKTIDQFAVFNFIKAGTQYLENNTRNIATDNIANPIMFEDLRIGNATTATTLVFSGDVSPSAITSFAAYISPTGVAGITIANNSILDLPRNYNVGRNYSLNVVGTGTPCFLKMLPNSKLRIGGNGSEIDFHTGAITGVVGSNFPNIRGDATKYQLAASSTVEYYGNSSITQTIYNTPTPASYGNLLVNNNGGTPAGTLRAPKITIPGQLRINTSFKIDVNTDVTLGTANNLNTCPVNCIGLLLVEGTTNSTYPFLNAGGLYCNANLVSGVGGVFTMGNYSYLGIGNFQGISPLGSATGNIRMTGARNYKHNGNYIYNGTIAQITGTGLQVNDPVATSPTFGLNTINDLTINNPTTVTIAQNQIVNGVCLLAQGIFDIGTTKITSNALGKINSTGGQMKADAVTFAPAPNNQVPTASATVEMKGNNFDVNTGNFVFQNLSGNWFTNNKIATLINYNTRGIIIQGAPTNPLTVTTSLEYGKDAGGIYIAGSAIKTNDNLILLSKPNAVGTGLPEIAGTANFGNAEGNFIDGKVSIERYLNGAKSWRFLAAPVQLVADDPTTPTIAASWREGDAGPISLASTGYGTTITGPTGPNAELDLYTIRGSMKWYNASSNVWIELSNTTTTTIANKEGYMFFVRGDRGTPITSGPLTIGTPTTLRMKGKVRTGDQKFDVLATRFLSVGNPYPSRIDFKTIQKNNIASAFTAWNPNKPGVYTVGAYEDYILNSSTGGEYRLNGLSTGVVRKYIESGEAFFIQNSDFLNLQNGDIIIKEKDKVGGSAVQSRPPIFQALPALEIAMFLKSTSSTTAAAETFVNNLIDGATVIFDNMFSNDIDNNDVRAINNIFSNLAIKKAGRLLVSESRPSLGTADTVYLSIGNMISIPDGILKADYSFDISFKELSTNPFLVVKLKDNFLNTETVLNTAGITQYQFTATSTYPTSYAADRFMIVFAQSNIQIGGRSAVGNIINPVVTHNNQTATEVPSIHKFDVNAIEGIDKSNLSQAIQPNPITNGMVNLRLDNNKAGKYVVQITNQLGQLIRKETLQVQSKNSLYSINIGNASKGSYQATIIDEDGNKNTIGFVVN
jgi:hypothetical protein